MQYKFCPRCGTKLPVNAKFCVNCGYKFTNVNNSSSVNQRKQTSSNQDAKSNNQRPAQPKITKQNQNVTPNREVVHQSKSHHNHQGMWVLVVIIVLILGLGGYAVYNQRANHYGNDVSRINQKSKRFSKSDAQEMLNGLWASIQNGVRYGKAVDPSDNSPMDSFFISGKDNKNYKSLHDFCIQNRKLAKTHKDKKYIKTLYYKPDVVSKTPNSHRITKVTYVLNAGGSHIKNQHLKIVAVFKLTTGGAWNIEKEHMVK